MICKILTDKKSEYTSIVLALINPGWKVQALVLNENKTGIIKVPIYETFLNIKRKVFIIDSETKGWEKSQVKIKTKFLKRKVEVEGYDWAIKKLSNMNFDLDDVKKAKALDEFVYWIDENIDRLENITDEMSYFKARSLKWKIIIEK